jgi:small-conductance mechanosensitive channel
MIDLETLLKQEFFGTATKNYGIALIIFLALLFLFKIFEKIIIKKLRKLAKKTKTDIDDHFVTAIESIPHIFYIYISFYIAIQLINIHPVAEKVADVILVILIIYWATKVASDVIEYILKKMAAKHGKQTEEKTATYFAISLVVKIILWSTGFLLILSNLGVNISALVASLGIGGIAVALAVQNILGDMFSSFSIYIDKPFDVGDFIIVGEDMGTVKKIGLKTTRVNSLHGEEIVFSNHELTSTRIRNYKKMQKRRILFGFGVTYDTNKEKLEKIPAIIADIINNLDGANLDRAHFKEFGTFSLNFEVVYYLNSSDYNKYMDAQQAINLAIKDVFEKEGIEMAFPTQTIHMDK